MSLSRSTWMLVLLNVAWLAVASYFLARHFEDSREPRVEYVTNFVPVMKSTRVTIVTNTVPATNDFRWAQLESEDYRAYIERLRSIGCPEQTIRDIVVADVDKLLAPKVQAASAQPKEARYWQPLEQELWNDTEQRDALQKQREVDFEKREVIRELLGIDLVGERLRIQGQDDYYGQRLEFLPEEKRARVRLVLDQFADRERLLLEEQMEQENAAAPLQELKELQEEKQAAIAQWLTPGEREQFDLWFSPAASRARDSVYGMDATEEEFLKIYHLQREFDSEQGNDTAGNPAAREAFDARIREALGEHRYAEYVRAQDHDFRELVGVTRRFKLPPGVASELYSYKGPVEEERARVEADPALTPQQKAAAREAIRDETHRAFKEVLGEKAFRQLMRRTSNRWLRGN